MRPPLMMIMMMINATKALALIRRTIGCSLLRLPLLAAPVSWSLPPA
jgi:hypothetical protein